MVNKLSHLRHALDYLGIPKTGVLQVHASFRGLSKRGWDAGETCAALAEYMCDGTLLMPSMSWRNITPHANLFDARSTPSHTGILAETFRARFATFRSLHPTHSVSGVGRAAEQLLSGHSREGTPCGRHSPYGQIYSGAAGDDSRVLLIDVGFECCTAIHHPEELVAPDIYLRPETEAESYELIDFAGVKSTFTLRRHARRVRDFQQYGHILAKAGALQVTQIEGVGLISVDMRYLMQLVYRRLQHDPSAHFPYRAYTMGVDMATFETGSLSSQ